LKENLNPLVVQLRHSINFRFSSPFAKSSARLDIFLKIFVKENTKEFFVCFLIKPEKIQIKKILTI